MAPLLIPHRAIESRLQLAVLELPRNNSLLSFSATHGGSAQAVWNAQFSVR